MSQIMSRLCWPFIIVCDHGSLLVYESGHDPGLIRMLQHHFLPLFSLSLQQPLALDLYLLYLYFLVFLIFVEFCLQVLQLLILRFCLLFLELNLFLQIPLSLFVIHFELLCLQLKICLHQVLHRLALLLRKVGWWLVLAPFLHLELHLFNLQLHRGQFCLLIHHLLFVVESGGLKF